MEIEVRVVSETIRKEDAEPLSTVLDVVMDHPDEQSGNQPQLAQDVLRVRRSYKQQEAPLICNAFSTSGYLIAGGSEGGAVHIWRDDEGETDGENLGFHSAAVTSITFSPDDKFVLSGSRDGTAIIWKVGHSSATRTVLQGHNEAVSAVAWSPVGTHLATGSEDGSLRLWDARSFAQVAEWGSLIVPILSLAFSPDGLRLASGSAGHMLRIWDIASGGTIASQMHNAAVNAVSFSSDGSRILTGSEDGSIWVWGAYSGELISFKLKSHQTKVLGAMFFPEGSRIVSGATDGSVNIWNPSTNEITIASVGAPNISSLALSPPLGSIAFGLSDGSIIVNQILDMTDDVAKSPSPLQIPSHSETPTLSLDVSDAPQYVASLEATLPTTATPDIERFMTPRTTDDPSHEDSKAHCAPRSLTSKFRISYIPSLRRPRFFGHRPLCEPEDCQARLQDKRDCTPESELSEKQTDMNTTDLAVSLSRKSDAASSSESEQDIPLSIPKLTIRSAFHNTAQVAYGQDAVRIAVVPVPEEQQRRLWWCCL